MLFKAGWNICAHKNRWNPLLFKLKRYIGEIQWCRKKEVREEEKQQGFNLSGTENFAFIHINRESASFTVSHLSYKPLDPQGEWLSEGVEAPSTTFTNPTRLAALFFSVCIFVNVRASQKHTATNIHTSRHASKHLYSAALISFPATVFQQRFLWERG